MTEEIKNVNAKIDEAEAAVKKYASKDTVIILKRDNMYEPIYLYEERDGGLHVKKTFSEQVNVPNIKRVLTIIQTTTKKYCNPQASLPHKYIFKKNYQFFR